MSTPLPDPESHPELFESILTRRVVANVIDSVILVVITSILAVVGALLGILTLGLGFLVLPLVFPLAIVAYYALTLGSSARATWGMAAMDLVLTPTRNVPLDGWRAFLHALIFWITIWVLWPLLLLPLFTPRRQMLHDFIVGVLMVRRSPMERHWRDVARDGIGG